MFHASIEPGLMMFKIYHGSWYFGRPSIEVATGSKAVLKKVPPDWDIATPR
jgi:hypothetical protein